MIRLTVTGAAGRMGKAILKLVREDKDFKISGAVERPDHPLLGSDLNAVLGGDTTGVNLTGNLKQALSESDVLIDFTHISTVRENLNGALKAQVGYVLGTTGLDGEILKLLKTASQKIPIVQSPNMSIGVNVLFGLSELAAKVLDESYDIEIAEVHHRGKKDAPSGTALKLLEILAAVRKRNPEKETVFGRKGDIGVRPKGEIGISALRGGDVIGEHTVSFFGDGERIELTHRASSRDVFAKGAVEAAKFIAGHKSGFFDMRQVLGMS